MALVGTRSCQQECTEWTDKEDIKSTGSDEQIARTKTRHRKGYRADIGADRLACGAHFRKDFLLTHSCIQSGVKHRPKGMIEQWGRLGYASDKGTKRAADLEAVRAA